jgi:hypothetical protein
MNAIAVFIADLIPAKGSRYFPLGKKRRRIIFSLLPQVLLLWLALLGKVLLPGLAGIAFAGAVFSALFIGATLTGAALVFF